MVPYSKEKAYDLIGELVDQFDRDLEQIKKRKHVKEAHVEDTYIKPLFSYLNWNVTSRGLAPGREEFLVQASQRVAGSMKEPDYLLRLPSEKSGRMKKWLFIEAKHPKYDLTKSLKMVRQAYQYAHSTLSASDDPLNQVRLALLTDFEEFRLFDCLDNKPLEKERSHLLQQYVVSPFDWTYHDYVSNFDALWDVFERNQVAKGSLADLCVDTVDRTARRVPPDERFLADIERWRTKIAHSMWHTDKQIPERLLTAAAQLMIDRLVFVKMLTDREIEDDFLTLLLRNVESAKADELSFYDACLHIFRRLDKTYNGSIFARRDELDAVSVENEVLYEILTELMPENTVYTLAAMPVEILGNVYERFLGNTITIHNQGVKIEQKPEVRKAKGVYYTPRYIVEYIVDQTLGKVLESCAKPEDVAKLKILDPACGSGSFLIGAYERLLAWHQSFFEKEAMRLATSGAKSFVPKKYRDMARVYEIDRGSRRFFVRLTTKARKEILLNNIFGVDIDAQAVEVAQFSLSMKAVEGAGRSELYEDVDLFHTTVLPDLEANIRCGNSLIGPEGLHALDEEDELLVNAFNWHGKGGFPAILDAGGFDVVIGNPPYLNIDDTWGRKDPRLQALKLQYPQIYNDKTDILFYFLGKAVELCKGAAGFIVSRAFLEAYKADKLRSYLASNTAVEQIVDFRNYHIFQGVGITTCILTFRPGKEPATVAVYKMSGSDLPSHGLDDLLHDADLFDKIEIAQSDLTAAPWLMTTSELTELNRKIDLDATPLEEILIIGQGMQTGRNGVFGKRTKEEIDQWEVPRELVFLRAANSDIQRYRIRERGEYILYPQPLDDFDRLPPGVRNHFLENEVELKARAAYKRGDCEWWKYTWPLHEQYYDRKRIVCPYLAKFNRFALVDDNKFLGLTDTTVLFDNSQKEDLMYLLGLLNSKLLTVRFRSIGKLKSNDIIEYFWNSVSKIPIRRIDFGNDEDRTRHDRIVASVNKMQQLHRRLAETKLAHEKSMLTQRIDEIDESVDREVYQLYGLTPREIELVESLYTSD